MPPPQKKNSLIFLLEMAFWCFLSGIFCQCLCQKIVEFFASCGDLVDFEDVLLGNSEYSVRIMGLISFLLHYCIVMQAGVCWQVFEILKNDKIWGGQFALASPTPNSGGLVHYVHVNYNQFYSNLSVN